MHKVREIRWRSLQLVHAQEEETI
ncbi:hypothetical protein OOU_Y34scaffold00735g1 [Pyricularia oryzae Y34]|uniref:Uncharacterized protein n=1 Tax=Pyricularia oryzae (strain Y34) TaxID=1143189 RepID=A0AA97NRJ3_PYRO3|nr:hypothetical protein OOU_Y34scaffold00735g1 [Pyricularia oryzae Y34]